MESALQVEAQNFLKMFLFSKTFEILKIILRACVIIAVQASEENPSFFKFRCRKPRA